MITVQYTCNSELLGRQIRHGDRNIDDQYKLSVLIVTVLWTIWYQQGSLNFVHASLFPLVVPTPTMSYRFHSSYSLSTFLSSNC